METLLHKVMESLTRPESLVLLLWVISEKIERRKECAMFDSAIDRMLKQERERGEVLARISGLLQGLIPSYHTAVAASSVPGNRTMEAAQ